MAGARRLNRGVDHFEDVAVDRLLEKEAIVFVKRGAINHMGGCMKAGGVCIGCTMPGFPDKFSPFYKTPPGSILSTGMSRGVGAVIRRLRRLSNRHANREVRWDVQDHVPSGWGTVPGEGVGLKAMEYFYKKWQFWGAKRPGRPPGTEDRFWGVQRPGQKGEYIDRSGTVEDTSEKEREP